MLNALAIAWMIVSPTRERCRDTYASRFGGGRLYQLLEEQRKQGNCPKERVPYVDRQYVLAGLVVADGLLLSIYALKR